LLDRGHVALDGIQVFLQRRIHGGQETATVRRVTPGFRNFLVDGVDRVDLIPDDSLSVGNCLRCKDYKYDTRKVV
jgi:hypothetical protein